MIDIKSRKFPYKGECPICCDSESVHRIIESDNQPFSSYIQISCPTCGIFRIGRDLYYPDKIKDYVHSYIVSGVIREANETFQPVIELNANNIGNYLSRSIKPATFTERLDKILLFINKKTETAGQYVQLTYRDYPICFAKDKHEFYYMVRILFKEEYIEFKYLYEDSERWPDRNYTPVSSIDDAVEGYQPIDFIEGRPSIRGWEKIDKLTHANTEINNNQCFVAMWFDDSMNAIWQNGILPGILDAGYKPVRIDKVEHNDQITDKIIAEIRQSKILLADFTGQRPGVYYEAGFARALNKTVISCCRKDDLKNLHFDTRQYSHIIWETPEELREKIKNRILATAPLKYEDKK